MSAVLLFVHAHPDDETLATGVSLAHHRAAGHGVHVLTCTLGEEGEVIPPELAHLAADRDDTLGRWRREELRRAMAALGVQHQVLGEDPASGVPSRYRDSGMAGTASAADPRAFVNADAEEAAALVGRWCALSVPTSSSPTTSTAATATRTTSRRTGSPARPWPPCPPANARSCMPSRRPGRGRRRTAGGWRPT